MNSDFLFIIENYNGDDDVLELADKAKAVLGPENVLFIDVRKDYLSYLKRESDIFKQVSDPKRKNIPCFFSGSIQLAKKIKQPPSVMSHAVHATWDNYKYNWFLSSFGKYALNKNCIINTYSRFMEYVEELYAFNIDAKIFVRPLSGEKDFSSGVYSVSDLATGRVKLGYGTGINPEDLLVYNSPSIIKEEFRFFIKSTKFNGEKIDIIGPSSPYIKDDEIVGERADTPPFVVDFVKRVLDQTTERPDILFVMDIAVLNDGMPYVLEINSGSCSGVYYTDKAELLDLMMKAAVDQMRYINNGYSWSDSDRF